MTRPALSALLLAAACASEPPPPDPEPGPAPPVAAPGDASDLAVPDAPAGGRGDVYLVVFDTLRADHLGAYGAARPTSPHIDALAAEGLRFTRAYSQSGWTLASFSSLLTGQYPHQHRVARDSRNPARFGCLTPDHVTVAEAMKRAGYRTSAFVNNTFLAPEFGLQQGFDRYDFKGATNSEHRTAAQTVEQVLAWVDAGGADEPTFSMVHFMEPHLDYAPPAAVAGTFADPEARPAQLVAQPGGPTPWALMQAGRLTPDDASKAYAQALYDEEILTADQALGALVAGLAARGRLDRATVVVTADHGEEFWEHGGFEHGHALWSELTRVPLVVRGPGLAPATVDTVVEHVDLVRGLLARSGAPVAPTVQGDDLFALATQPTRSRASLQENCLYGPPCISLVDATHRLLFRPTEGAGEVWAVDAAGLERERLQGEAQTEHGKRLINEMNRRRGHLKPIEAAAGPKVPSAETFHQLAALGYVDAEASPSPTEDGAWRGCTGE